MKKARRPLTAWVLLCLCLGGAPVLVAQEADPPGAEAEADPGIAITEMDINTSTLPELADWCRSLGLSEGGTKAELASRLKNHYGIPPAVQEEGGRIITIESARTTEYFTLEVVDEEYARFVGDVVINLKEDDAVHRIRAWEVLFNRTRNVLTASGGVEYVREEGETRETFKGESITMDLDNWAGVFLDGVSERSAGADETVYRFSGTLISRSDQEVTVLTRAKIVNAGNKESLWSLEASKLWLLPGSDWAVANAVLKVGEVPVFYLPFFFYPADEIIFHPVLGYRSRAGSYVQTTTYLLGRPQAATLEESSLSRMAGTGADMEKRREGVFLRSTGRKARDPNTTRLSLIMDAYANLGAYIGTELTLPQKGIFGPLELSGGIGFSRDIYPGNSSGSYTPFAQYDGTSHWNNSYFFSETIPFRFRFKTTGSLSGKYGSLAWTFPFYSDPFVDEDFLNRSEDASWLNLLRRGVVPDDEENLPIDVLGDYEWSLKSSLNLSSPVLAPYITNLSFPSIASTVAFKIRNLLPSNPNYNEVSPNRTFFFPDRFILYSASASIAGTPFSLGASPPAETSAAADGGAALPGGFLPRSPWGLAREEGKAGQSQLHPPALAQGFDLPLRHALRFSVDYQMNPSGSAELQFRSSQFKSNGDPHWLEAGDIRWGDISSILGSYRLDGSNTYTLSDITGLFSTSFRFYGNASWQDYMYTNDEAEEFDTQAKRDSLNRLRYNNRFFETFTQGSALIRPFYASPVWGDSSLKYTLGSLFIRSRFDSASSAQDPRWDYEYGNWNRADIETHQVAADISALVMDKKQTLLLSSDLWPELPVLSADATMRVWISETNARWRIREPYHPESRFYEPLYFTETLQFIPGYSAQQYMEYDPELQKFKTLTSSLILGGFGASYSMAWIVPYEFNYYGSVDPSRPDGWVESGEAGLHPRDFRMSFAHIFKKEGLWKNRLSFSVNVNTSLLIDLQRYTYSRFSFSLGITFKLINFLDLSFTTTSENAVIYRYFQDLPFFSLPVEVPGEKNPFVDLYNSFRFDKRQLREESGFKLKSLNVSLTHHLGDWNAKLGVTLTPYLDNTSREYKFNNEISFLVQWVPLSEIKSEINYDKDHFVIE
jgi:hypothetical protein